MSNTDRLFRYVLWLTLACCVGCGSTSRYSISQDRAPQHIPESIAVNNAQPQYHIYYPPSLREYKVLGTHYQPLDSAKNYADEGYASWYGKKFHGHLTSTGETYNMFEMTAAHKFLPLPTYVRVLNLNNQKSVIVKVNDRGPFHDDRIIDLSYAAAKKLDMLAEGTARVRITSIVVEPDGSTYEAGVKTMSANNATQLSASPLPQIKDPQSAVNTSPTPNSQLGNTKPVKFFIQIMAMANKQSITAIADGLAMLFQTNYATPQEQGLYKLHLGPWEREDIARKHLSQLQQQGYDKAFIVSSPSH